MQFVHKSVETKSRKICSVPQCSSYCTKNISLHAFPSDPKLREAWKTTLNIAKLVTKYMYVCSLHFTESDFTIATNKRRRLKKRVIPHKNFCNLMKKTATLNMCGENMEIEDHEGFLKRDTQIVDIREELAYPLVANERIFASNNSVKTQMPNEFYEDRARETRFLVDNSETQASASQGLLVETTKMDADDVRAINVDLKQENVDTSECRPTVKPEKAEIYELNDVFETGNVLSEEQLSPSQRLGLDTIKKDAEDIEVAVEQQEMDVSDCKSTLNQEDVKIAEDSEKAENNGFPMESIKEESENIDDLDGTIKEEESDISDYEVDQNVQTIVDKAILMAETAPSTHNVSPEESVKVEEMDDMEIQLKQEDMDISDWKCEVKQEGVALSDLDGAAHKIPTSLLASEAKIILATQLSDPNGCLPEFVKKEIINSDGVDVTIKQEQIEISDSNQTSEIYLASHDYTSESPHFGTSNAKDLDKTSHLVSAPISQSTICNYKAIIKKQLNMHQQVHTEQCQTCNFQTKDNSSLKDHSKCHLVKLYKCETCDFQTKSNGCLRRHSKVHLSLDEVEYYKCGICDFQTKHKSALQNHSKRHLSLDEVKLFKCETCDFQTRYKSSVTGHQKIHLNPDEVELYKCETCNLQFKDKKRLKRHLKLHLSLDEVEFFKCEDCDFQTRYKTSLVNHSKRHLDFDKVEFYKCESCDFQTKDKVALKKHSKRHLSLDEVELFKCETCAFQTREKRNLKSHSKVHLNFDEVELYKCKTCDFQTKRRMSIIKHSKLHLSLDEVELFKCENCDFQTRYKTSLISHLKQHSDFDELYKCETCDFQTKDKRNLKRHAKVHLHLDEVELFKCETCGFQAREKSYLNSHAKVHLNLDEVELYKCETCDFQTRYKKSIIRHSKRH